MAAKGYIFSDVRIILHWFQLCCPKHRLCAVLAKHENACIFCSRRSGDKKRARKYLKLVQAVRRALSETLPRTYTSSKRVVNGCLFACFRPSFSVVQSIYVPPHQPHPTFHIPHATYHIPHTTYHKPQTTYHIPQTIQTYANTVSYTHLTLPTIYSV